MFDRYQRTPWYPRIKYLLKKAQSLGMVEQEQVFVFVPAMEPQAANQITFGGYSAKRTSCIGVDTEGHRWVLINLLETAQVNLVFEFVQIPRSVP